MFQLSLLQAGEWLTSFLHAMLVEQQQQRRLCDAKLLAESSTVLASFVALEQCFDLLFRKSMRDPECCLIWQNWLPVDMFLVEFY